MPQPPSSPASVTNAQIVRRLLGLAWHYRARSLQVFFLQAVLLLFTLAGLGFTGLAVDVIRHSLDAAAPAPRWVLGWTPPPEWSAQSLLLGLGGALLVAALFRGALSYAFGVAQGRLVHKEMVPNLRVTLFHRLQRLSFRFFDANSTGAIINRLTSDVQMLRAFVDGVVVQGAILVMALAFFVVYMLQTHVQLTFVSLLLTPLLYVATSMFSRWARPAYRQNRRLSDRMVRAIAEGIEGIVVTKVFGREPEQFTKFQRRNLAVRQQQRKIFKAVSRFSPGIDLLNQLNIVVLLSYGGILIAARAISLGDLVVFAGLLQQFAARASGMAQIVNTLQQSMTAARRVFEVLDAPFEVHNPERPVTAEGVGGSVEFDDVHFGYDESTLALVGVSLRVEQGQCVGILGATGSGKSTLLSLIPRFYDPSRGVVRVDGRDIREFDVDSLRRKIGIVFQESLLFRDTIANNIAFGHPLASRKAIEEAAVIAGADGFIRELPEGYDTHVEEGAVNLSGGQKQRIAIARALLLKPPILVLDDPTTAIDAQTESEVLQAVDSAINGRTTFIISNRLSSLRRADWIIVLEGGRIAERGKHEQLLRSGGLYQRTAEIQGLDAESQRLLAAQECP